MPRCKWCGEKFDRDELTARGYCENCNEKLRKKILDNKAVLENCLERTAFDLSPAEQQQLLDRADEAYRILGRFKKRRVAFFTSDINGPYLAIYAKLGREAPPAVQEKKRPSRRALAAGAGILLAALLLCLLLFFAFRREALPADGALPPDEAAAQSGEALPGDGAPLEMTLG